MDIITKPGLKFLHKEKLNPNLQYRKDFKNSRKITMSSYYTCLTTIVANKFLYKPWMVINLHNIIMVSLGITNMCNIDPEYKKVFLSLFFLWKVIKYSEQLCHLSCVHKGARIGMWINLKMICRLETWIIFFILWFLSNKMWILKFEFWKYLRSETSLKGYLEYNFIKCQYKNHFLIKRCIKDNKASIIVIWSLANFRTCFKNVNNLTLFAHLFNSLILSRLELCHQHCSWSTSFLSALNIKSCSNFL